MNGVSSSIVYQKGTIKYLSLSKVIKPPAQLNTTLTGFTGKQVGLSRATLESQVKDFILILVHSQVQVFNRLAIQHQYKLPVLT